MINTLVDQDRTGSAISNQNVDDWGLPNEPTGDA